MTNEEHDKLLIERIKKEDHEAFRLLVDKYKDQALSLAYTFLKDKAHAEDVLQEVFIRVYKKIKSFKYQSAFYTWLYRIVVNHCHNELRKRKRSDIEIEKIDLGEDSLSEHTDLNDKRAIIQASLDIMKFDEALVLKLFYLSELKMDEVVEVTEFSLSKVKVTLQRARKNLAVILREKFGKEIEEL